MTKTNRVALIYRAETGRQADAAILQKMKGQAAGFQRLGFTIDQQDMDSTKLTAPTLFNVFAGVRKFFFFFLVSKNLDFSALTHLYIRFAPFGLGLPRLVKKAKTRNPDIKIYVEFATYPYLAEYPVWKRILIQWIFKQEKAIISHIDSAVQVMPEAIVEGVNNVFISNGIQAKEYSLKAVDVENDALRLIFTGSLRPCHGLDRLIKGMYDYLQKHENTPQIKLTIIGKGKEEYSLKELARALKMEACIDFHGWKHKDELAAFFDKADLAVGSLAMDRIGLKGSASLKHREYLCRGIPFFYGGEDKALDECPYTLSLALEEKPIDFHAVVSFYQSKIYGRQSEVSTELRKYAEKKLSWEKQLEKLLNFGQYGI
jgi:hypothetical protein